MNSPESTTRLKTELRQALRTARQAVPAILRESHDRLIHSHLTDSGWLNGIRSVAGFWPHDGEPDLRALLGDLQAAGVEVALPVIRDTTDELEFHGWHAGEPLQRGRFGIPAPEPMRLFGGAGLDLVLVPLVGWDQTGARLGMGAGYYDRWISRLGPKRPRLLGIAYRCQCVPQIPVSDRDQPLDAILCEDGLIIPA